MRSNNYRFNEAGFRRVTISVNDVGLFNRTWPASPIEHRRHFVEFDRDGNLVDHDFTYEEDGAAALALIDDADSGALMTRRMSNVREQTR